MADIVVRGVEEDLVRRVRADAALKGLSFKDWVVGAVTEAVNGKVRKGGNEEPKAPVPQRGVQVVREKPSGGTASARDTPVATANRPSGQVAAGVGKDAERTLIPGEKIDQCVLLESKKES